MPFYKVKVIRLDNNEVIENHDFAYFFGLPHEYVKYLKSFYKKLGINVSVEVQPLFKEDIKKYKLLRIRRRLLDEIIKCEVLGKDVRNINVDEIVRKYWSRARKYYTSIARFKAAIKLRIFKLLDEGVLKCQISLVQ